MDILIIVAVTFLGMALGSFIGMASYRWPRRLSWGGRSFCDGCGQTLQITDLIPVLTWVSRRGFCRCGQKWLGMKYLLLEAGLGLVYGFSAALWGFNLRLIILIIFAALLAFFILVRFENPAFKPRTQALLSLVIMGLYLALLFTAPGHS